MAQTAAQRTFAISELLEKILELLPAAESRYYEIWDGPVRSIYSLQRVNKAFRDTIRGSPSLQKLMWIRPVDDPIGEDRHGYICCGRISWFLAQFTRGYCHPFPRSDREADERQSPACYELDMYQYAIDLDDIAWCRFRLEWFDDFVHAHSGPHASWRKIKAYASADACPVYLKFTSDGSKKWRLTSSTSLEDIFIEYSKLMETVRRYLKAVEAVKERFEEAVNAEAEEPVGSQVLNCNESGSV